MSKLVMVREAFYRGETVEGMFELVQDYTPFRGEKRRNGKMGAGFIKVAVSGETLNRLAPNTRPVKLTVEAEGVGYAVEGAVGTIELKEEGLPGVPLFVPQTVNTGSNPAELLQEIEALRADLETQTGAERAATRKRLRRREAKLV